MTAHIYPGNYDQKSCEQLADKYGLEFTAHDDFPSWHYPGHTMLVSYRKQG
jgi:hypothetical protein